MKRYRPVFLHEMNEISVLKTEKYFLRFERSMRKRI